MWHPACYSRATMRTPTAIFLALLAPITLGLACNLSDDTGLRQPGTMPDQGGGGSPAQSRAGGAPTVVSSGGYLLDVTGGSSGMGGSPRTGGVVEIGGNLAIGATGGFVVTGGIIPFGGTIAVGGYRVSGGFIPFGGTISIGGIRSTGGAYPRGTGGTYVNTGGIPSMPPGSYVAGMTTQPGGSRDLVSMQCLGPGPNCTHTLDYADCMVKSCPAQTGSAIPVTVLLQYQARCSKFYTCMAFCPCDQGRTSCEATCLADAKLIPECYASLVAMDACAKATGCNKLGCPMVSP